MELIIKMPDEAYNELIKEQHLPSGLDVEYFIIHGTPLPKGHGDLIDADKMIKELNEHIQTLDKGRNEILRQLGKPEENNQIPLWMWKGSCKMSGIIIEADKEDNDEYKCKNCSKAYTDDCPKEKCWKNNYSEFIEENK